MTEPVRSPVGEAALEPARTDTAPRDANPDRELTLDDVSKILRELRTKQGSSLAAVSQATGLSQSFISLVEAGKSDISFGRLLRLLQHYGVRLADVITKPDSHPADIVRPADRLHVSSRNEGIDMYLLTPDTRRELMALLVTYQGRGKTAEFTSHPGEEFIFVLDGTIELTLEGSRALTLHAGDSVHFSAELPHLIANTRVKEARLLAAITPPTW